MKFKALLFILVRQKPKRNELALKRSLIIFLLVFFALEAIATDEVILRRVPGILASPENYTMQVLKEALDATIPDYGPYTLKYAEKEMNRSRTFNEMQLGERVNIADTPITESWSDKLIRIPIPVQRGILSYRLFLVNKDNKDLLTEVETLEDLKKIRQGSGAQWAITTALKDSKFNIIEGTTKDSLLNMLSAKRFDIYGRGINEIFGELADHGKTHPDIVIDQHIALYSYLPTYFHVSPSRARIAERIDIGLRKINATGRHEELFLKHHQNFIKAANLEKRKIFMLRADSKNDEHWNSDLKFLFTTPDMR